MEWGQDPGHDRGRVTSILFMGILVSNRAWGMLLFCQHDESVSTTSHRMTTPLLDQELLAIIG